MDQKPLTKTEIINALCEATELNKQQVTGLLDELSNIIAKSLGEGGPGAFTLPGLMKIKVGKRPCCKKRSGLSVAKGMNPSLKKILRMPRYLPASTYYDPKIAQS